MKMMLQLRMPENELTELKEEIPEGVTQSDYLRDVIHQYVSDKEAIKRLISNMIEEAYHD